MIRYDGAMLRQIRQQRRMTQRELGTRIGVREEVAQQTISSWEKGGVVPHTNTLPLLAAVLECTITDLFSAAHDTRSSDTAEDTETPTAGAA